MRSNPVWDKSRQENFTDAVNRNKQNAWLGNFANNSTAGKTGNKENPVEEGAKTIIYLSTDDSVKNITGKYFYQNKIDEPSIFAQNQNDADLLWEESLKIVKNKGLTLV